MSQENLEEIQEFLRVLLDARNELQHHTQHPVDRYFTSKIDEWSSKILGISNGYRAEFLQMYKHRIQKGRTLEEGYGDVTVGDPDDLHASTIQLKSTISDTAAQVNTMIKVALNQLSGERGEMPRQGDRVIVDMTIHSPINTWPGGASTLGEYNWQNFEMTAKNKLLELCEGYRKHSGKKEGYGLSPSARTSLTNVHQQQLYNVSTMPLLGRPNSSQVVAHHHGQHPSNPERVKHLTIKIRYLRGYPIKSGKNLITGENTYSWLALVVFNVFRVNGNLQIQLNRHKFYL